jgi:hypothetical protein
VWHPDEVDEGQIILPEMDQEVVFVPRETAKEEHRDLEMKLVAH